MGTDARLVVVADDPAAGHRALMRAAEDLQDTEKHSVGSGSTATSRASTAPGPR